MNRKQQFYKVSIYEPKLKGYKIVAVCVPSEEDAIIFCNTLIEKGFICRYSKH